MLIAIDDSDESGDSELITDPIIKRYSHQLHLLTRDLINETEDYPLNREQINQFIDSLKSLRTVLVFAEDLDTLDSMLRVTFPDMYYEPTENVAPMLTYFPLSKSN